MFVQTKSSILKNKTGESCKTVIFKSNTSNKEVYIGNEIINAIEKKEKDGKEFNKVDMKKLRYEIIKFGTSGFDGSKKEESMVAFAVALGAKPPKKKPRNYVDILKENAVKNKSVKQSGAKPFSIRGTTKRKRNKGKESGGLLKSYGKMKPSK